MGKMIRPALLALAALCCAQMAEASDCIPGVGNNCYPSMVVIDPTTGKPASSSASSASALTSRSVTTVAGASQQLFPANSSRKMWFAQAPQSAGFWFNPTGGVAGPNLTDSFYVPPGGSAGSTTGSTTSSAINYYCATAGLVIAAVEN